MGKMEANLSLKVSRESALREKVGRAFEANRTTPKTDSPEIKWAHGVQGSEAGALGRCQVTKPCTSPSEAMSPEKR